MVVVVMMTAMMTANNHGESLLGMQQANIFHGFTTYSIVTTTPRGMTYPRLTGEETKAQRY